MNNTGETLSVHTEPEVIADAVGSALVNHSVEVSFFRREPGGGTVFIKPGHEEGSAAASPDHHSRHLVEPSAVTFETAPGGN